MRNTKETVYPCIIKNGEKILEWKSHDELDNWQTVSQLSNIYLPLLKGFHRGFQFQNCEEHCIFGPPTLTIQENDK